MKKKVKAFTILELLVVISIIVILASILLPALSKIQMKGYSIECISRLKSQGLCFMQYTNDSGGWLFTGKYFEGVLSPYNEAKIASKSLGKRKGIFGCPLEDPRTKDSAYKSFGWYGISPYLSSVEPGRSSAVQPDPYMLYTVFLYAKIKYSTNNFLRADGGTRTSWIQEFSSGVKNSDTTRRTYFGYNHLDRTNFLFLDMHAESLNSSGIITKCIKIGF